MSVLVVEHDPAWTDAFAREALAIGHALGEDAIALHHIGSTAIPGILAKPIIDLLGVVPSLDMLDLHSNEMRDLGYEVMGAYGIEGRRYFRKFDNRGRRAFHLHAFAVGSEHVERHLAFRDYLRSHPQKAAEYSALKQRLVAGDATSWDAYSDGKDGFVAEAEREALDWVSTQRRRQSR